MSLTRLAHHAVLDEVMGVEQVGTGSSRKSVIVFGGEQFTRVLRFPLALQSFGLRLARSLRTSETTRSKASLELDAETATLSPLLCSHVLDSLMNLGSAIHVHLSAFLHLGTIMANGVDERTPLLAHDKETDDTTLLHELECFCS